MSGPVGRPAGMNVRGAPARLRPVRTLSMEPRRGTHGHSSLALALRDVTVLTLSRPSTTGCGQALRALKTSKS